MEGKRRRWRRRERAMREGRRVPQTEIQLARKQTAKWNKPKSSERTYETSNNNTQPNTTMKSGNNAWLLTLRYPSCRQRRRRRRRHRFNLLVWVCCACCLPQQKLKFKQSKRANTATTARATNNSPLNDSQLRCRRRCPPAACCWSFSSRNNSTTSRRRRLSLSSFLQLCLPTSTHTLIQRRLLAGTLTHTHTYLHLHTLTFYARLLLLLLLMLLLLFRRLHTHFMLCSLSLAHSLSLLCYGRRKCFCFWFICGNPLGFVAIAFAFMLSWHVKIY